MMRPSDFIYILRQAIAERLMVPEPYILVVETDLGSTCAILRDRRTGSNRYAVDLGSVRDADIPDAANRAVQELQQQLGGT